MNRTGTTLAALVVALGAVVTTKQGPEYTPWQGVVSIETFEAGAHARFNTEFQDGCPAISRDGLTFYIASNRPGGQGGLDLWVSHRQSSEAPWSEPENLGPAVNTAADEFCPGPTRDGKGLLFVSSRPGCGGGDMYLTRRHQTGEWSTPVNLGCHVNSAAEEASPHIVEYDDGTTELFFSSTRAGGFSSAGDGPVSGDSDLYVSIIGADGSISTPALVAGVNSAAQDARPHVRRDGLEIFFDSNRPGSLGVDIWSASRAAVTGAWDVPVNLGAGINSAFNETRPYLSWDGRTLYIGSTRPGEGSADIYAATRERVHGQ